MCNKANLAVFLIAPGNEVNSPLGLLFSLTAAVRLSLSFCIIGLLGNKDCPNKPYPLKSLNSN